MWNVESADAGAIILKNIFNVKDETLRGNYEFTFAASKKDGNKTVHAATITYNYGKISSVKDEDGNYNDYVLEVAKFNAVYNDIYNEATYSLTDLIVKRRVSN